MNAPTISIVTASRNRSELLRRCLDSVSVQDHPRKEHVVVDDGSTDDTPAVLAAYAEEHPHVRWVSQPHRGLTPALNVGLALTTGDLVTVCGDDDYYEPGAFRRVAAAAEAAPEAGLISGHCNVIRSDGTQRDFLRAGFTNRGELLRWWKFWTNRVMLPHPSTFARRGVLERVGGFDERDRYAMDYHHFVKITEHFGVHVIDETLANVRWDEGTISYSLRTEQYAEMARISRMYWGSKLSPGYYAMLLSFLRWYPGKRFPELVAGVKKVIGRRPAGPPPWMPESR